MQYAGVLFFRSGSQRTRRKARLTREYPKFIFSILYAIFVVCLFVFFLQETLLRSMRNHACCSCQGLLIFSIQEIKILTINDFCLTLLSSWESAAVRGFWQTL